MNLVNVLLSIASLLFLMIGIDKFYPFLDPPCTMLVHISPIIWKTLGALQIISAFLLWSSKYRRYVAGFWMVFMFIFVIIHLTHDTSDFGGALFMALLMGILVWNPSFIHRRLFNHPGSKIDS